MILTIDPNFQRDIQVHLLCDLLWSHWSPAPHLQPNWDFSVRGRLAVRLPLRYWISRPDFIEAGQIIATSAEVTPKCDFLERNSLISVNSRLLKYFDLAGLSQFRQNLSGNGKLFLPVRVGCPGPRTAKAHEKIPFLRPQNERINTHKTDRNAQI